MTLVTICYKLTWEALNRLVTMELSTDIDLFNFVYDCCSFILLIFLTFVSRYCNLFVIYRADWWYSLLF